MKTEKVTFEGHGGHELSARIDWPLTREPIACALFAHCFTCSKDLKAVKYISKALTGNGIAVMRFDFTGLGESDGDFSDTNFSSNVDDLIAAADYMREHIDAPSILIGHSLGGAAVLLAGSKIESVNAIATIGAPAQPVHVQHQILDKIDEINSEGEAVVELAGRPFTVKKQFIEDIESNNLQQVVQDLRKPLLIAHSPQDNTVGIENAADIYNWARHPKSFVSLDGADHLLSKREDAVYMGNVIATWSLRYIDIPKREDLMSDRQAVAQTAQGGFLTEVKAGKHFFLADEPENVGGGGMGPTPYDLLASALATCTTMTLQMYAGRKEWPLENVRAHVQHGKCHALDCGETSDPSKRIDRLEVELELEGDLTEEQRKRLFEIAHKCPVHRTLTNEIVVDVNIRE